MLRSTLLVLLLSPMAYADYGHLAIPLGGLSPETLPAGVKLSQLDVSLSAAKTAAKYQVQNTAVAPAAITVNLDVPRYFVSGTNAGIGGVPLGNVLRVGKKIVPFTTKITAFMCDEPAAKPVCRDVTAELTKLGLTAAQIAYYEGGPNPDNKPRKKALPSLTPEQYEALAAKGYVDYQASAKEWPNLPGHWGVDLQYTWKLTIPASSSVTVAHQYQAQPASGDLAAGHTQESFVAAACPADRVLAKWKLWSEGESTYLDTYRYADLDDLVFNAGTLSGWGPISLFKLKVPHASGDVTASCVPGYSTMATSGSLTQKQVTLAAPIRVAVLHKEKPKPVVTTDSAMYGAMPNGGQGMPQMGNGPGMPQQGGAYKYPLPVPGAQPMPYGGARPSVPMPGRVQATAPNMGNTPVTGNTAPRPQPVVPATNASPTLK